MTPDHFTVSEYVLTEASRNVLSKKSAFGFNVWSMAQSYLNSIRSFHGKCLPMNFVNPIQNPASL